MLSSFVPVEENASQDFLDTHQYTVDGVKQYERIFGEHFISTGGKQTTERFTAMLGLKPGMKVLDIGCGIGGSSFYMASTYGVHVHGVDLSSNMVSIAKRSLAKLKLANVSFQLADATAIEFEEASFDVIYSRDCLMHVSSKLPLFSKVRKWLRPGGRVFISDYIVGPKPWSFEMAEYMRDRDYKPITLARYRSTLRNAGLVNVVAKDNTLEFIRVLKSELRRFEAMKQAFVDEFSAEDYEHIAEGWKTKAFERCPKGDLRWGVFYAEKASQSYTNVRAKL